MRYLDIEGTEHFPSENEDIKFRPGVYVIVKRDDEILMIVDEKSGKWEFPGGGLKIGETLHEGAIREVLEETGYKIRILDEMPFHISEQTMYFRIRKIFIHALNFFYLAELEHDEKVEQNFDVDENILEVEFKKIKELKNLDIPPFQKEVMKKFLQK